GLRGERLPVKSFTSADGLGSSFVSYTMRDSHGFLWFCTRDGLSRFDGSTFVTYQIGKNSPPGIEQIIETRNGIYWIATTGGLYRFDPTQPAPQELKSATRPTLNAIFVSENRGCLFEDGEGNLWLGGSSLILIKESDGKISYAPTELGLPASPTVRFTIDSIFQGQDASLWLVTTQGLVRRLPDGRRMFYAIDPTHTDRPTSAIEDAEGRIWIGRSSGVYVIKPETFADLGAFRDVAVRQIDQLAENQAKDRSALPQRSGQILKFGDLDGFTERSATYLYQTSDHRIWISAGNGVIEYDGARFKLHAADQGLGPGGGAMIEDPNGNLWLSWVNGLKRLDRRGFTTFNELDGIKTISLVGVGETTKGDIYAVSSDFLTSVINEKGLYAVRPAIPLTARPVWLANPLFQDSAGEWWALTNEKLYRFPAVADIQQLATARPTATYDSHNRLNGQEMRHIFEDSRHDLWISTRETGSGKFALTRFNRSSNTFYTFSEKEGFPTANSPTAFAEDRQGNLWFGEYEGGLLKFAGGRFTLFTQKDGIPQGVITSLLLDKDGRLWIGSSLEGLRRLDDPTAEVPQLAAVTTNEGLTSNNVRTLAADNFGNIYAGTARGVDRLSPDGARIRHFTVNDGLAGDFVVSSIRDHQGNLWFATLNGLSKLVPEAETDASAPQAWFGGLQIAGENRPVPQLGATNISGLELAAGQNNLQIDFFAIDFHPNENLRYQFKLEGADGDWNAPTAQHRVNFANLSPGSYRFLVRTVNADGVEGKTPAVLAFRILPPIWRRWWFLLLALFAVGGAVLALDRYRVAKTRQVESALLKSIESETRFRTLADTASDAIITIDTQSNIVFVNEAVEKIFGYSPAELIGKKLTELMPQELRSAHEGGLHRYVATNEKQIGWSGTELPGRHKSGALIPLELSFGEFELKGARYFTGVARDITERKRAEEALERAQAERLAELERVRNRIARDLHDDVGSSLTQIALFSEVAKQKQSGAAGAAEPLEFLVETSNELVEAMSDIVWAINPAKDHLLDLTQRMRRFAAESFTAAGVDLDFEAPSVDAALGANIRREVFLIFKESVNNIVKHAESTQVRIEFSLTDALLVLNISDNGRGFDDSAIGADFDWETTSGGNGLLSMKRRAEELGGEYVIESVIGRGTQVRLQVPLT
ncbi:MAG: two-component regulator propeller domain-containing protein, partial [Pyrinomonadaceae bacterium]